MRNPRNDTALASTPAKGIHRSSTSVGPKAGGQPSTGAAGLRRAPEHKSERTCILSRRHGSRDELIRLALGPSGEVLPDVRAKAPGRGAWIGVPRADLDAANAKGKLKGALARAFKTGDLLIPADLGEKTEAALRQAALDRLGMEARSGNLINGADRVEQAARSGKVRLLLHAADAGDDGRRRLDQAWRVGGSAELGYASGLAILTDRTILSMALGRENVVHIALTDAAAAARVLHALSRWRAFIDPEAGLGRGDAAPAAASADDTNEGTR